MVAGDSMHSSLAALRILEKGGNAFDAAAALAAATSVNNPTMNDLFGGDAFIIVYSARDNKVIVYNGTGWAPQAATIDYFIDQGGIPDRGILTVSVPGSFSGWMMMLQDYGTLPLKDILAPAIHLAENGFRADDRITVFGPRFLNEAGLKVFAPGGTPLQAGEVVYNKGKADMLRRLSVLSYEEAEDYFYRGPLAKKIVEYSDSVGGILTVEDFAKFRAERQEGLSTNYRGIDVYVCPPNSQGMALLKTLNILEGYDLKAMGHNSAEYIDILVQALNLALQDRNDFMGDPRFVDIPYGMISKEYARHRRENDMHPGRAMPDTIVRGNPADFADAYRAERGGDTTFFAVADTEGNLVAVTTSICDIFGSGLMVPGLGIMLNNRMTFFYLEEEHPNHVVPGKRTMQTITPSIALRDGKPYMAFGTPGGDLQEQSKLQGFLNMVEFGMSPQEAVEAPRFQSMHPGGFLSIFRTGNFRAVRVERRVPEEARNALEEMGYTILSPFDFLSIGNVSIIKIDQETGWKEGAADPRSWNTAVGW